MWFCGHSILGCLSWFLFKQFWSQHLMNCFRSLLNARNLTSISEFVHLKIYRYWKVSFIIILAWSSIIFISYFVNFLCQKFELWITMSKSSVMNVEILQQRLAWVNIVTASSSNETLNWSSLSDSSLKLASPQSSNLTNARSLKYITKSEHQTWILYHKLN